MGSDTIDSGLWREPMQRGQAVNIGIKTRETLITQNLSNSKGRVFIAAEKQTPRFRTTIF